MSVLCEIEKRLWMWRCGSSARRAMRDTLLAATMAPSLPRSGSVCAAVVLSSCADTQHRHAPVSSVALMVRPQIDSFLLGGRAGRAPDGQGARRGEGRQTGPLWLSIVTIKRSSKDTERRDRGRIQVVRGVCSFFSFAVIQVVLIKLE